jgi:hypothetical protein
MPKEIERARLQARISRLPGQHLILVHYGVRDVPSKEWIYNRADIDNSKIVWARDMGSEANQELLCYFAKRHVWYVDHGGASMILPYSTSSPLEHPTNSLPPDQK